MYKLIPVTISYTTSSPVAKLAWSLANGIQCHLRFLLANTTIVCFQLCGWLAYIRHITVY